MISMELLEWWNLVFVVPFVAALVFLLLQLLGVLHIESGADADVDVDVEADPGVEHLSRSLPGLLCWALARRRFQSSR